MDCRRLLAGTLILGLWWGGPGGLRAAADGAALWQDVAEASITTPGKRHTIPAAYRTLRLEKEALAQLLSRAPREFTEAAQRSALELVLPLPDGRSGRFRVVESPMLAERTAREFPSIRNYSGQGLDEPAATMRCDLTVNGFHAIILTTAGSIFIEPYADGDDAYYISYFTRDDPRGRAQLCLNHGEEESATRPPLPNAFNQAQLRTYFLAAAATGEFTQQFRTAPSDTDPTLIQRAMADINTTVMAVNAIYNRDLAIRVTLLGRSDLIFTDPATDGYTSGNPGMLADREPGQARRGGGRRELRCRPRL